MSKKKKSNDSNNRDNFPTPINMDDLALMSDEELNGWGNHCEAEKTRSWNPVPWETEIAYVRREQQIRKQRLDAHSDYLRHNPNDNIDVDLSDEVTQ